LKLGSLTQFLVPGSKSRHRERPDLLGSAAIQDCFVLNTPPNDTMKSSRATRSSWERGDPGLLRRHAAGVTPRNDERSPRVSPSPPPRVCSSPMRPFAQKAPPLTKNPDTLSDIRTNHPAHIKPSRIRLDVDSLTISLISTSYTISRWK